MKLRFLSRDVRSLSSRITSEEPMCPLVFCLMHELPTLWNLYLFECPMHSPERIAEVASQHEG